MNKEMKFDTKEIVMMCLTFLVVGIVLGGILGTKINEREVSQCQDDLSTQVEFTQRCIDSYEESVKINHRLMDIITYRACKVE